MDAADVLYGVSMGGDGVTKVVSRRLPREVAEDEEDERSAGLVCGRLGGSGWPSPDTTRQWLVVECLGRATRPSEPARYLSRHGY